MKSRGSPAFGKGVVQAQAGDVRLGGCTSDRNIDQGTGRLVRID